MRGTARRSCANWRIEAQSYGEFARLNGGRVILCVSSLASAPSYVSLSLRPRRKPFRFRQRTEESSLPISMEKATGESFWHMEVSSIKRVGRSRRRSWWKQDFAFLQSIFAATGSLMALGIPIRWTLPFTSTFWQRRTSCGKTARRPFRSLAAAWEEARRAMLLLHRPQAQLNGLYFSALRQTVRRTNSTRRPYTSLRATMPTPTGYGCHVFENNMRNPPSRSG